MFADKLSVVPHLPGSYQMKNKDNVIIYVGKAKDLHNRLQSYFRGNITGKTKKMVSEIANFEYIVTNSELEAFILELNLIKKYNPRYNILLTDDKSYPYIEYVKKPYPKLQIVRYLKIKKDDNKKLFGPYQNAVAARKIVNLINRLYPLKKCVNTPKEVCLYYHIEECLGYCTRHVNETKIQQMENEILSFLRGNDNIIKDKLKEKIELYSNNLNYEKALELKQDLDFINIVLDKQKVELHDLKNRDVVNYYTENGYLSIVFFFIRNGKLVGNHKEIFALVDNEIDDSLLYIADYYEKHEVPNEIIIPESLDNNILGQIIKTNFVYVLKGQKKKMLDMVKENAKINLINKFLLIEKDEKKSIIANQELGQILNIDSLYRIDLFDNSNLFGSFSVSGMVVFKDGKPAKKDYRKYKVSVEKNDDYNTMKEVIYRRYYKALLNKEELPDLIIVDGGINQINACKDVLDDLHLPIRVCGLKKNDKHRTSELVDGNDYQVISIAKDSELFYLLTRMQDEVHRFTINYHRQIRSRGSIASILDEIEGIGSVRRKKLIKEFGNINGIKDAADNDLAKIIPLPVVLKLKEYLKNYK